MFGPGLLFHMLLHPINVKRFELLFFQNGKPERGIRIVLFGKKEFNSRKNRNDYEHELSYPDVSPFQDTVQIQPILFRNIPGIAQTIRGGAFDPVASHPVFLILHLSDKIVDFTTVFRMRVIF